MKNKIILGIFLILIVNLSIFVTAVVYEINPQESTELNSGNNKCEYYQNKFSTNDSKTITVNGESLNIKYLGNGNWKLNDYEGNIKNHDYFVYNQNKELKGVRFAFGGEYGNFEEGGFALSEQHYYPWDCQGYSQSTGLISEIKINEGWNLVPMDISLRECYFALNGELCKDDVLVSYIYIPSLYKYFNQAKLKEEIESNPELQDFFKEENEHILLQSSKWIYIKPGVGNKKVIGNFGAYIPYRNRYLDSGMFKLYKGWNHLYVDAFMVYDDEWQQNPLNIFDIAGDCELEKVYLWDPFNQKWIKITEEFDDDFVGYGIIVKTANECNLGFSNKTAQPPTLPEE